MPNFDAVIFDWSGTLVHDPTNEERVALAFAKLGRIEPNGVESICDSLRRWESDPEVVAAQIGSDTSGRKVGHSIQTQLQHFEF